MIDEFKTMEKREMCISDEILIAAELLDSALDPHDPFYESSLITIKKRLGKRRFGRELFVRACIANGIEPKELQGSQIITEMFSEHIPKRTVAQAWKMVLENFGLLIDLKNRGIRDIFDELNGRLAEKMFYAMLYFDETKGTLAAYVRAQFEHEYKHMRTDDLGSQIRFPPKISKKIRDYERLRSNYPNATEEKTIEMIGGKRGNSKLGEYSELKKNIMTPVSGNRIFYAGEYEIGRENARYGDICNNPPENWIDSAGEKKEHEIMVDMTRQAMYKLKPRDREIAEAYYVKGETMESIAAGRGFSKQNVHRILKRVRDQCAVALRQPNK